MNKKDDAIQKLFDDYANDLATREELANRAKQELVAKKQSQRKSSPQHSTRKVWAWLAPLCCALVIGVFSLSIYAPIALRPLLPSRPNHNVTKPSAVNYYAVSEVKGRSVSLSDCDDALKVSQLKDDVDYQVVSEKYYAFYFEDGTLAYVKGLLGVRCDEGFCEIVIIAESDGYVRDDLSNEYRRYLKGSDNLISHVEQSDNGEYVTTAYFNARNMHFYVYAMTGANSVLADKIISNLL